MSRGVQPKLTPPPRPPKPDLNNANQGNGGSKEPDANSAAQVVATDDHGDELEHVSPSGHNGNKYKKVVFGDFSSKI